MDKIVELATNNANVHITKFGAEVKIATIVSNKLYFVSINHPKLVFSIEESINVAGLPNDLVEEYVHCRVHGLAARLISKLYPEK